MLLLPPDIIYHHDARKFLKGTYPVIFHALTEISHRHDPMGIPYRWKEYKAEVSMVLPPLFDEAESVEDVLAILVEVFMEQFGCLGRRNAYEPMAEDTWDARNRIGA